MNNDVRIEHQLKLAQPLHQFLDMKYNLHVRLNILLLVVLLSIISCTKNSANVQIVHIIDDFTGIPLERVNIVVHADDLGPGEDGSIYNQVKPYLNIPIEVGKCTFILVEAEGYND